MERGSAIGIVGGALGRTVGVISLLVVELIATMLVYTYLNLQHVDTFGSLVRLSKSVLDLIAGQIDYWLQGSSSAAYASLFGELGPKSILLLLTGLVVGALIRGVISLMRGLAGGWE